MRVASTAALATLDAQSGSPYASLVSVATAFDVSPILLISTLAQHRRNIANDCRVSLLFDGTAGFDDPLEGPRVSIMGEARRSDEPCDRARFLARHPGADYADFADFDFFRVSAARAHLVAGFGRISWIEARDLCLAGVGDLARAEAGLIDECNSTLGEAIERHAVARLGGSPGAWRISAIDPDGADLSLRGTRLRLDFGAPIVDPNGIREALTRLIREPVPPSPGAAAAG